MPSIPQTYKTGPRTYDVVEAIAGGQVVEARTNGVGVAAAGSFKGLGVALDNATPTGTASTPTVSGGYSTLAAVVVPKQVAVAHSGEVVPVTYVAAANFGDKLICAAAGQVTPAGATPDARTIIGTCDEQAGVSAGAVGLMRTR